MGWFHFLKTQKNKADYENHINQIREEIRNFFIKV